MRKEMRKYIDTFKQRLTESENYIVSYTKDTTKTDVDVSIGSDNLDDLVKRLKSILSASEFQSIFKIETGSMSFG